MDAGSSSSLELPQQFRQFTISEIHLATRNFDESLVIGRGGFGMVYKGTIIHGATQLVAAIKRLDSTSNQGAAEFWAEIHLLSKFRHCHLVSLMGYCNDGQEMILVYEYMRHGTLEDHLHKFRSPLPWVKRLKICIGAARGLDYLHTGTGIMHGIIHRDVKSSNILLDESWAAKISDFGLSKLGPINQPATYVNTFVKGTFGYLDPDYYATGRLTRKSDVYAFGVVLFEVLSGKKAVDSSLDEEHWGLVNWAQESIKEGRLKQIVDYSIKERILPKCLKEFARLADQCLHSNPKQRPTMAEVVVCLDSVLALQEKASYTLHPAGMRIFGNKVPTFLSWSNGETSVGGKKRIISTFEFETISVATQNFSWNNKISQWGNGSMYKGRLQNGQRVSISSRYDFDSEWQDFKNEVGLRAKLEHENLLKLVGYCIEGTLVSLVFEFALCESLHHILYDPECTRLDWNKRKKIVLGVARALLYLHQHDVIHGNVKPGTILLDESLHPNLSDSGLPRCLAVNEADCVVADLEPYAIRETLGDDRRYLAPEYLNTGHLSTKADVFSFGVLIFETISGYRIYEHTPSRDITILEDVFKNWLEGTSSYITDPRIDVDSTSIARFIHIGLLCVQLYRADRPTMEEVVGMMTDSSSLTLPLPKIYKSHWMLEEYSVYTRPVCTEAVRSDAVHTDAVYTDAVHTDEFSTDAAYADTVYIDTLLANDYDQEAVLDFLSELDSR